MGQISSALGRAAEEVGGVAERISLESEGFVIKSLKLKIYFLSLQ